MKRRFRYITIGRILEELWEEASKFLPEEELWYINSKGQKVQRLPIDRVKFYREEDRLMSVPNPRRTDTKDEKHRWREYTRKEADAVKEELKRRFPHKFRVYE
jgi:hypothetical protein